MQLLVVDDDGRLAGIISSLSLLIKTAKRSEVAVLVQKERFDIVLVSAAAVSLEEVSSWLIA